MPLAYIRLGALGEIYLAESDRVHPRGRRVIVRSPRGVELAEVVGPADPDRIPRRRSTQATHRVLRATTDQDELLVRRLERHKRAAIENCRRELSSAGSHATLLDVDQLFDGGTLVMHFLGPVDEVAESITQRIVAQYESIVRTRHLAKLLHEGCGPACGTSSDAALDRVADKIKGSCGGCAGCAMASGCRTSPSG